MVNNFPQKSLTDDLRALFILSKFSSLTASSGSGGFGRSRTTGNLDGRVAAAGRARANRFKKMGEK
jgi:hypothetical protein